MLSPVRPCPLLFTVLIVASWNCSSQGPKGTVKGDGGVPDQATENDGPATTFEAGAPTDTDSAAGPDVGPGGRLDAAPFVPPQGLTLLAGRLGGRGHRDLKGALARLNSPMLFAVEGGHAFVAQLNAIRKIALDSGEVTTLAGSAIAGHVDGTGAAAQFTWIRDLVADHQGNLYLSEAGTIRKVVIATGEVVTISGLYGDARTVDGVGQAVRFYSPAGLVLDGSGNLFITDSIDRVIRQLVLATGEVKTIAGTIPTSLGGDPQDGIGVAARFASPSSAVGDNAGNLYIADNNNIRRLNLSTSEVTTVARQQNFLRSISFHPPNGLVFSVAESSAVWRLSLDTQETAAIVGTPGSPGYVDGPPNVARIAPPWDAHVDGGDVYLLDSLNHSLRKASLATGEVRTVAGAAPATGKDDGVGTDARFNRPTRLTGDGGDELYVVEDGNKSIRRVSLGTGKTSTIVGSVPSLQQSMSFVASAPFSSPAGVLFDPPGRLFVTDIGNNSLNASLFSLDLQTNVATLLHRSTGWWTPGPLAWAPIGGIFIGDNFWKTLDRFDLASKTKETAYRSPMTAPMHPHGIALDGRGNAYVASTSGVIFKVVLDTGAFSQLAGRLNSQGFVDGIGTQAQFAGPTDVIFDGADHLLVADSANGAIRRVSISTREVTTWIGIPGQRGVSLGSFPTTLNTPRALFALPGGGVAIVDEAENAVLLAR